jgi:hypothetical protein
MAAKNEPNFRTFPRPLHQPEALPKDSALSRRNEPNFPSGIYPTSSAISVYREELCISGASNGVGRNLKEIEFPIS